jgi:hypothetical protein
MLTNITIRYHKAYPKLLVHKKAATKLSLQKTDDEPMNGGTYI